MAKAKLDVPTLMTIVASAAAMAGGAIYITRLGAAAEQDMQAFFTQLRLIMLIMAGVAFLVAVMLSRRIKDLATRTEAQRRYPPEGVDALPSGVADPCSGDEALMVAARLRGYALLTLCFGIGAGLAGLLFSFPT
jgi:hypothetical protein